MAEKRISYTVRDFAAIRQELIDYTRQYYPELIDNFNDASIFSVLMDLNAAVTDNLHYHIDRSIQETVLEFAKQRSSIYNIARTYGLKIPGNRPSIAVCDISINVPVFGDRPNPDYMGVLKAGSQFVGAGQTFENPNDINFSSAFSSSGIANQKVIPILDASNNIQSYNIIKREVVVNGITKVFKKVITSADATPFLSLYLPERNVVNVLSIIQKDGITYNNIPAYQEFLSPVGKWYEVPALAEDTVFIPDPGKTTDQSNIKVGKYIRTSNKFITEFTPENFLKLTFGGGNTSADDQLAAFAQTGVPLRINDYQNNLSLGYIPTPNTTLFIQYRVGGGLESNVGVNVINTVGNVLFDVNGASSEIANAVRNSIQCTNVTAAIGGANPPSVEEVRNLVTFNFSSQNRAVTIGDYYSLIQKMPGQFGIPAKVGIIENNNKINVVLLTQDTNGKMTQNVPTVLKDNVATYLSNYRMMNDYVSVTTGKVIDLAFEIYISIAKNTNQNSIISDVITKVNDYMIPQAREFGQNVLISEIKSIVQNIEGVINISDVKVFGRVGGKYSSSQTAQKYEDSTTKQIKLIDDIIYAEPTEFYQIRYSNTDIGVRVKQ
jgi:Baseplate J-like protein